MKKKNIPNLLNSLFNQSYNFECYEIIIINDRSDDNTENIISNYKNHNVKLINIDKTPLGWSNKKWALNSGIKQAQGEIILQTDADCIPNEFWIETMVNAFAENNVGFIFDPLHYILKIILKIFYNLKIMHKIQYRQLHYKKI